MDVNIPAVLIHVSFDVYMVIRLFRYTVHRWCDAQYWHSFIWYFTGHDTKAMLNNSGPRYKHSKVERDINLDVIACVVILFTLCFLCGVGKYLN